MIQIRNLLDTPLEDIVACMVICFEGYFVKLSSCVDFWSERFSAARVDYAVSFGAFQESDLIGFVIIAIGQQLNELTAYNTGTGVIPSFRGKGIIDDIYRHALPILQSKGIRRCSLEVICDNDRAITLYNRLGFVQSKRLLFFQGVLQVAATTQLTVTESNDFRHPACEEFYSWDCSLDSIRNSPVGTYKAFEIQSADGFRGYFVMNPTTGLIVQYEIDDDEESIDSWRILLAAISQITNSKVIWKNVDIRRQTLCSLLSSVGLENFINQYEMELTI
jgi:ribosomal protein S18 acetylase RimI-like enzyme